MKGAVVVGDRMQMAKITEMPIKAGVNSLKRRKSKGVTSFERFLRDNVSVRDQNGSVISSGAISHLSG